MFVLLALGPWPSSYLGAPDAEGAFSSSCPSGPQPCRLHTMDEWTESGLTVWTWLQHGAEALDTGPAFDSTGTQLHLSQDCVKGHETLQPKKYNLTPVKTIHPPMQVLKNNFLKDIIKTPLPGATEKFDSLVTIGHEERRACLTLTFQAVRHQHCHAVLSPECSLCTISSKATVTLPVPGSPLGCPSATAQRPCRYIHREIYQ